MGGRVGERELGFAPSGPDFGPILTETQLTETTEIVETTRDARQKIVTSVMGFIPFALIV